MVNCKKMKKVLMEKVNNNQIQCLVSTTVVEVGINNPNATIMVIENSERFGLTPITSIKRKGWKRNLSILLLFN